MYRENKDDDFLAGLSLCCSSDGRGDATVVVCLLSNVPLAPPGSSSLDGFTAAQHTTAGARRRRARTARHKAARSARIVWAARVVGGRRWRGASGFSYSGVLGPRLFEEACLGLRGGPRGDGGGAFRFIPHKIVHTARPDACARKNERCQRRRRRRRRRRGGGGSEGGSGGDASAEGKL